MMNLNNILNGIEHTSTQETNVEISRIVFDSRKAGKGDLFVAMRGVSFDGHQFIGEVVSKGVPAVLCEEIPEGLSANIPFIVVEDAKTAMGLAASNFYNRPSKYVKMIGITGTNGKTSIATLLHQLFMSLGYHCGLISTVENLIGNVTVEATHTTPDSVSLNALLAEMVDAGCEYVFMEVSSHAAHQNRIAGLEFDGAVFTNITHDHLDYHKTFDGYIAAKKSFFDGLSAHAFALVNSDDKRAGVMLQNTKANKYKYGLKGLSDFKGKVVESHFDGTLLNFNGRDLWTKIIGGFNASNLLAVYAVAILLEQDEQEVLQYISNLKTVEGRFDYFKSDDGITAVVDYAHTPDAVKNIIDAINHIRGGAGKLITVIGAGGDRDKTKRPVMAFLASRNSNKVVLTSDNPRSEDPQVILDEMFAGVEITDRKRVLTIVDRAEAIKTACMLAEPGDVILVAGKGHETYQEIKGVKKHFSDKEVLENILLTDNKH